MPKPNTSIARVVVPVPLDEPFSYKIPEDLQELIQPGVQVVVPFGERYLGGIVIGFEAEETERDYELKSIHDVVSPEPFIAREMMDLLAWISDYYICHLGEAYRLIHPSVNLKKSKYEIRRLPVPEPAALRSAALRELLQGLPEEDWINLDRLENKLGRKNLLFRIHRLKKLDLLETRYTPPAIRQAFKKIISFRLLPETSWQAEVRKHFHDGSSKKYLRANQLIALMQEAAELPRKALQDKGFSSSIIQRLEKAGVIQRFEKEIEPQQENSFNLARKDVELTASQQGFVDLLQPYLKDSPAYKAFLLHGVTGSGKTEVYLELIRRVVAAGRQAIVLIPEIILTPQMMARFRNHFGDKVAVLNSRLSPGERLAVFQKIRQNEFSIVIGPRSAIFAPFKNLGLIIIDEEHESSYKQNDAIPRYHGRDVALYRAWLNNIPIVMGSATPGIESLHNARSGKYQYYHLAERIHSTGMPRIYLADLKAEWKRTGAAQIFTENLLVQMESRMLVKEQCMLLQNRRGFSPYIQCNECGHVEKCQNCDITLTYHKSGKKLQCHYCGYEGDAPSVCPSCKGFEILYRGVGTQRIEEIARETFEEAVFLRMDQDTTRKKGAHGRILEQFRSGEADVLIGTQMIAKGLDFERVTLVGIMNADHGLHFPDFRASERVFQLLVQAAGRSGRGSSKGAVIVQAYDTEHYIYKFVIKHDYISFYEREIKSRETLNYPPFSRLCLIRLIGESEEHTFHFARELAQYLRTANKERRFIVLGPAPAPIFRINNRYRVHIMLKQPRQDDPSMSYLRALLKQGIYKNGEVKKWPVKVQIDVDPLDIL